LLGSGYFDGYGDALVEFPDAPKALEGFTLKIQLSDGNSTSLSFEKRHASYWRAMQQIQ